MPHLPLSPLASRRPWRALPLGAAVSLLAAAPAQGQTTLYENLPVWDLGVNMNQFMPASDFILSSASTLDRLRFWTFEETGFYGSFYWALFADGGNWQQDLGQNPPAPPLHSGEAVPTRTFLGPSNHAGWVWYENVIDLPAVDLDQGRFWLSLHNGPLSQGDGSIWWAWGHHSDGTFSFSPFDGFEPGGFDFDFDDGLSFTSNLAFSLEGSVVPEPATLLLLGTGLVGMGGAVRLRRGRAGAGGTAG